ncbi:keratin, type II cytoskeletal 3 [Pogona vitticeps]
MGQQFFSCSRRRRGFTSASSVGDGGGIRFRKTSIGQPSITTSYRGEGNTSRSFHNFGQMHRISYGSGHRGTNRGDSFISGRISEPLCLGVDPQDHQVKAHEKEQMKDLNTQFASFIDKVRCLEQRNQALATKWELLQSHKAPMVQKDLTSLCENYIGNLRGKLSSLLCEKAQLQSQHKALQDLIEENRHKYEEELNRRTNAENEFILLKQDVDRAFKHQKELELKRELLEENVDFLRNFFAKECSMLDYQLHDTSVIVNMDNRRCLDMDALIQNIESWYQSIAQRSKEEVNLFYWNQMEHLQNKCCEFHENLKKNKNEIAELNRLVQIKRCQVEREKKKVGSLQAAIRDTEHHGDHALKTAEAKCKELQKKAQSHKDKLASLVRDYQELMNTKLALDIEIATYKSLLEGEEHRIYAGMPVNKGKLRILLAFFCNLKHFPELPACEVQRLL